MRGRGIFDYVPPEERSNGLRLTGFALSVVLIAGGVIAALAAIVDRGVLSGFVLLRATPAAVVLGVALWKWLAADPGRK